MSALSASLIADAPLLFWIGASILAYVAAANFVWRIRLVAWLRSPWGWALLQVGRFLYYLVVPYLALGGWLPGFLDWPARQGLLALEDVGLAGLNLAWPVTRWLEAAGTGLAFGLLALLLLWLAWAAAGRLVGNGYPAGALSIAPRPWWAVLVSGLYLEVHWAFFRGGLAVTLDDLHAGVFLGLAAASLEWLLNPFWRNEWKIPSQAGQVWLDTGLALTSALLFLLTRNLWVCLAIHWLLALAFWLFARYRERPVEGYLSLHGLPSVQRAGPRSENGAKGHEAAP